MNATFRWFPKFWLLSVVMFICGCAVMRIDVDVYKGPLANSKHIQMQQLATLAIGAKPLLIQLRDTLIVESLNESLSREKEENGKKLDRKEAWQPEDLYAYAASASDPCAQVPQYFGLPDTEFLALSEKYGKLSANTLEAHEIGEVNWYNDQGYIAHECIRSFVGPRARRVNDLLLYYEDLYVDPFSTPSEDYSTKATRRFGTGGRHPAGIVTLYERYLRLQYWEGANSKADSSEFNRLRDALVGFAQAMLIAANNEKLIEVRESKLTSFQLFTDAERSDQYINVLQAIGNSIIVQADELIHSDEHEQNLVRRAAAERFALAASLNRSASETLDGIIRDLKGDSNALTIGIGSAEEQKTSADEILSNAELALNNVQKEVETQQNALRSFETRYRSTLVSAQPAVQAFQTVLGTPALAYVLHREINAPTVLRAEASALQSEILSKQGQVDGNGVVKELEDWLETRVRTAPKFACGEIGAPEDDDAPRQIRIKCAYEYFSSLPAQLGPALSRVGSSDRAKALNAVREIITEHFEAERERVEASRRAWEQARSEIADSSEIGSLQEKVDAAKESATKAQEKLAELKARKIQVDHAVAGLGAIRRVVIERAEKEGHGDDAKATFDVLKSVIAEHLGERPADGASEGERLAYEELKAKLVDALAVLEKRNPPTTAPVSVGGNTEPGTSETQLDVLDDLIALLRYEHIQATKEGGGNGRAAQIQEALKLAYDQRSGMAFIRPSSSYLRSVFASTSLQEDPGLVWKNHLQEHGFRSFEPSIPLFDSKEERRQRVLDGIRTNFDKQFWQNINSVRVSGAGKTNYAIVKDDIGNWYVKAFSTDVDPIIKSAQQLAMFTTGANLDVNLLRRLDLQRAADSGDANKSQLMELEQLRTEGAVSGTPGLRRVYLRYLEGFETDLRKRFLSLRATIGSENLQNTIKSSWESLLSYSGTTDDERNAEKEKMIREYSSRLQTHYVDSALSKLAEDELPTAAEDASENDMEGNEALHKRSDVIIDRTFAALRELRAFAVSSKVALQSLELTDERLAAASATEAVTTVESEVSDNLDNNEAEERAKALQSARDERDRKLADLQRAIANRETAAAVVGRIVGGLLLETARGLSRSAEELEQAVVFVGDAVR